MNKLLAEFIGTFTLVLIGYGSAVIAGADISLAGISFAFGLALIGMAYGIGRSRGVTSTLLSHWVQSPPDAWRWQKLSDALLHK